MSLQVAHYFQLLPNGDLPAISSFSPFKAVVILADEYSQAWQTTVSEWLVEQGCRYMMAWGPICSSWDDSVDHADIARGGLEDNSKFVLTTWHDDETLERVFWFSQFCAEFSYDGIELLNTLLIDVSNVDRGSELLRLFEQSRDFADREGSD